MLSYREECFEQIGLKPSIKIPLFNGSLECEFRKYAIFDGKMREFRSEGGVVKTETEKRAMAEKHRFKKNREFKKRLEEDEENGEADIRSFKFLSLERKNISSNRSEKRFNKEDKDEKRFEKKTGKTDRRERQEQRKQFFSGAKTNAHRKDSKYVKNEK